MKENILVIDPYFSEKFFWYEKMNRLGFNIVNISRAISSWEVPFQPTHISRPENTSLISALEKISKQMEIGSVLPLNEFTLSESILANRYFNLPPITNEEPELFRDKRMMRNRLRKIGLYQPEIYTPTNVRFPLVAKPLNWSGSSGVQLISSEEELEKYIQNMDTMLPSSIASRYELATGYLLEEYIEGPEYSVEIIVDNSKVTCLLETEKLKSPFPYFFERGHIVGFPNRENNEFIVKTIHKIISSFSISNATIHLEYIQSNKGIVVIELALRPGGDQIPRLHEVALRSPIFDRHPAFKNSQSCAKQINLHPVSAAILFLPQQKVLPSLPHSIIREDWGPTKRLGPVGLEIYQQFYLESLDYHLLKDFCLKYGSETIELSGINE